MAFDPMDSSMEQDAVNEIVQKAIENNDVVLFMKGDRRMPQCGFSQRALDLITQYRPDVHTVDALQSLDEFRVALEAESGWETIPQTFVNGEFVGGSDILAELEERGELADELNADDVDEDAVPQEGADDGGVDDEIESPF
ncbi:glutaredoxin family protein [Halobacterium bonnevillei]|uniref:Glutaredoxin n=1 Tax=Halobacterium bonnevillei TaxID=2692200 RepID=A0A6B0SMY9_9EURY|nr:glutaredoxin domain-containing protein [Halobacterium bonnevillei]MXR21061.1 glutaredoxin [Halobacterium bonnevillei]